ncbi:blue-light-activated protein [mine drainage metagenome]|uniref:Blue-light-activated protein n=1 Tax=mine drainage metagenome TaxID=410659 RepID=A0A1J5PNM8_9ZZZZ
MALADFLPGAVPALTHVPASGHVQLGELSGINHEGGTVALEVSLSFEQHPQGAIVTLFAHDLTSRKKMESQRAALESQLRESQKMQAIGTMAGGIAHDFNNIISAILGNVELARGDIRADTPAAISLTEIDKAGRRARDLVRQILAFSRHEPPRRLALQLADVVLETVRLLKVTLPPQVQLLLDLDPHTPPILADATQIQQVLLNLCTNAIQAIGKSSGTVRLELRRCQVDHAPGTASHSPLTGESICLTVSDTGPGMSDVVLQRVFEPFFTTKPVGQGTGLGLSVVHGIMRTHQGSVQAVSTPGKGSSFTLFFPASPVALTVSPTTEETAMPAISEQAGSGQRVMYVDDDEALVFLVKRLLTRQGYAVTTHTDPRLALAAVRADPTHWHLVVTDFNMPGYSGIDLIRAIKAVRPELPVALASGYVTPEIERDALVAGANALIHKPNDVDELCGIVQKLLAKSDGDNSIG